MKKQILSIMIVMLLVGTAIAGGIAVSKEYRDALIKENLDTYNYTNYDKGNLSTRCLYKEVCETIYWKINNSKECLEEKDFCLVSEYPVDTLIECGDGCGIDISCNSILNTCLDWQDESSLDGEEKERMEVIAKASIERDNLGNKTKTDDGGTIIDEK